MYQVSLEMFTSFTQDSSPSLSVNKEACGLQSIWVAVLTSSSMGSLCFLMGAFLSLELRPLEQQSLGSQEKKAELLLLNDFYPLIPEPMNPGYGRNSATYWILI